MKVLVAGGTGFLGSHAVAELVARGNSVTVFGPPVPGGAAPVAGAGAATHVDGDIRDARMVKDVVAAGNYDAILHLAAYGGTGSGLVPAAASDPEQAVSINVGGLVHMLEAARLSGVQRVVWTSSTTPLGPAHLYPSAEVDEDAPLLPPNLYAATKAMGEQVMRAYALRYGLEAVSVRPTIVWGPGNWYRGIQQGLADLCIHAARGTPVSVTDPGEVWDLVYVKDCAAALAHFCAEPWGGYGVVHVSGHRAGVADVAAAVRALVAEAEITLIPGGRRLGIPFVRTDRAAAWGFRPKFGLTEAVADFVSACRAGEVER